jgi:hypothetical protein
VVGPKHLEIRQLVAGTHAQDESTSGRVLQQGRLFGDLSLGVQGKQQDTCSNLDFRCPG